MKMRSRKFTVVGGTDATNTAITIPFLLEIQHNSLQHMLIHAAEAITLEQLTDAIREAGSIATVHSLNGISAIALDDIMRGVRAEAKRTGKTSLSAKQIADLLSLAEGSVLAAKGVERKILEQRSEMAKRAQDPAVRALMDHYHGIFAGDPLACEPAQLSQVVTTVRDRLGMPELAAVLKSIGENHYSVRT
jgi:hypothetical protein